MRRLPLCLLFGLIALLPAQPAAAHLVQTGFGPLVDGLFHMLVGPDALMVAAAAGFLGAMRGERVRPGRWLFLYGWVLFYLAAALSQYPFDYPVSVALTLALLGVLVAADLPLPPLAIYLALGWSGGIYGLIGGGSTQGMEFYLIALMFSVDLVLLALTEAAARALLLRFPKARIAIRVAGSWITAIAMLQFGWAIKMRYAQIP